MNQAKALVAVNAALAESEKLGVKMNIAIVDAGGNLVMFNRMDGAWLGSIGKSKFQFKITPLDGSHIKVS